MHKNFANTSFLGKKSFFLPECHSTNDKLSQIVQTEEITEGFVVFTDHQINGRGQRGNTWLDEKGKSILTSVYLKPTFLSLEEVFNLYLVSGLAVLNTLKKILPFPEFVKIKWPNDILVDGRKVAGILIENSINNRQIDHCIVGIGLNVNQSILPEYATSILLETQQSPSKEQLLEMLLINLEKCYLDLKKGNLKYLSQHYHQNLFWKDELKPFEVAGRRLEGVVRGLDETGNLSVEINGIVKSFGMKEIKFLIGR